MRQQEGRLPVGSAVEVCDRLAGLFHVIRSEQVQQALLTAGKVDSRACCLNYEVTLWVVLAMGILTDLPIRQVFKACRRFRPGEVSPRRSSLCTARKRLGLEPLRQLFAQVVRPLAQPSTPGAFYRGWRLMAVDGTLEDVPDTDANAVAFGYPQGGRGQGAFPQVRKLSLVEVGTHAEVALALGPRTQGETRLVDALLPALRPGMLLLWDRNFFSYGLWKRLARRGVQILARVKKHLVLKPLRSLSDGSYLAKIYRSASDRHHHRGGLVVRVIRYTLNDPQRAGHGEEHRLLTTLRKAQASPAEELIRLYHERWEIELTYDEQKTHQDPRRATKPAQLRSQTPEGVRQELYALSLGHYVTRALMAQAAQARQLAPERLSFVGCLQVLRCRLPEAAARPRAGLRTWYAGLLWEMGQEVLPPRANRVNPRVVKRKMSKFKKKGPRHRSLPPLKKTFAETILILISGDETLSQRQPSAAEIPKASAADQMFSSPSMVH
jgi:hypothetical protein